MRARRARQREKGVHSRLGPIALTASRYGNRGLSWRNADAYDMPFEKELDAVVSFETIEHLKDPERFVKARKGRSHAAKQN